MELHGETYLFNLSLIAISFSVVSALVMVMRQLMGGHLSNFDVYLTATYISFGFADAVGAILPPLVALFDVPSRILWAVSSALAAATLGGALAMAVIRRRRASPEHISIAVIVSFGLHALAIVALIVNAAAEPIQGIHLFATALTLSLASVMWAFVRRIASVLGEKPGEDWDPKLG